jgi:hypothetical protein
VPLYPWLRQLRNCLWQLGSEAFCSDTHTHA